MVAGESGREGGKAGEGWYGQTAVIETILLNGVRISCLSMGLRGND